MKGTYNVTVMFVNGEQEVVPGVQDMSSSETRVKLMSRPEGESKPITIGEFSWPNIIGYTVWNPHVENQPAGDAPPEDPPDEGRYPTGAEREQALAEEVKAAAPDPDPDTSAVAVAE